MDWATFLIQLAEALLPFLMAVVSYLAYQAAAYFKQKTNSTRAKDAIDFAGQSVATVVTASSDAFMAKLTAAAEDGEVTKEEWHEARDAAIYAARQQLGSAGQAALAKYAGVDDIDEWLWQLVKAEARVQAPFSD